METVILLETIFRCNSDFLSMDELWTYKSVRSSSVKYGESREITGSDFKFLKNSDFSLNLGSHAMANLS